MPWASMQDGVSLYSTHSNEVRSEPDKVTRLYCAALCGFSGLVKHLILVHAEDVNTKCGQRKSPLHAASCLGHVDSAHVLLDHGADLDTQDLWNWTPLHLASEHGHLEVARLLVDHGANLNAGAVDHSTPLYLASKAGRIEVVRLLLEHGADMNMRGVLQSTQFFVLLPTQSNLSTRCTSCTNYTDPSEYIPTSHTAIDTSQSTHTYATDYL